MRNTYYTILILFIINGCTAFDNNNEQNSKLKQWIETEPRIGDSITVVIRDSTLVSGVYVGVVASIELNPDSLISVNKAKSLLYGLKIIINSDSTKMSINAANIRKVIIKSSKSTEVHDWGELGLDPDVIIYWHLNSSHKKASGKIL